MKHLLFLALALLPGPALAQIEPPATAPPRFDASLDTLVQEGVVSPVTGERLGNFDAEAFKRDCLAGKLPPACKGPVRWGTPAQQAVLERIRKARDGDLRTFGTCSYRWATWKLQAGGVRTTTYSCERSEILDHTIGVSCGKLKLSVYRPVTPLGQTPEQWAWSAWRLPEAGGEEQMVATLCANAMPAPAPAKPEAKPTAPRDSKQ